MPYILIGLIICKRAIAGKITKKNSGLLVISSLASLALTFWGLILMGIGQTNVDDGPTDKVSLILLLYAVIHSLLFAEIVTGMVAKLNPNQRKRCYFYFIFMFGILSSFTKPILEAIIVTIFATLIWLILSLPVLIAAYGIKSFSANFEETTGLKGKDGFRSILLSGGLGMSGLLAYYLLPKVFNQVDSLSLTIAEKILVAIVAIAPILILGFLLAKIIVKRRKAIAQYNRNKPNLIKP